MEAAAVARCYMRVSTEEQAQSGYSLAAQRDKLELFAQLQGYAVGGWYRDDGVSAKDLNRPAFRQMMQDAGRGDVIIVYKLDRLTRSVRDLDDLLRDFEGRGLHFRSVTEQFDTTTATGRLMIRMVGEFAQWERETIAERTSFGKQKKLAAGEWGGGRPPFGYVAEPSDRVKGGRRLLRLVPDPVCAHLVRQIFERYLAGYGVRGIAIWLNDELGARTALGRRFDAVRVARILQNPVYAGDLVTGRRRGGGGERRRIPSSHQPLIDADLFERVQATFAQRKRMTPRQATGSYALSGIARCGMCGGPVCAGAASRRGRQAGQYFYRCRNYTYGSGCGTPPLTSTPGPGAEAQVVQAIAAYGVPEQLPAYCRLLAGEQPASTPMAEVQRLEADMAEARQAIGRWDLLYEVGRLDPDGYWERTEPHRQRLRVLAAQRQSLNTAPGRTPPADRLAPFPAIWAAAEPAERKALLQRFTDGWRVAIRLCPGQHVVLESHCAGTN